MADVPQTIADASHSEDEVDGCCCPFFTQWTPRKASRRSLPARTESLDPLIRTAASEPSINPIITPATSPTEPLDSQDSGQTVEERISPIAEWHPSQRSRAEEKVKIASANLAKAMSNESGNVQIPAELLNFDRMEDTVRRGEKIELAIDALRKSQEEVNPSRGREQAVKSCLKNWINASFPVIKATLKTVVVRTLSNTISQLMPASRTLFRPLTQNQSKL